MQSLVTVGIDGLVYAAYLFLVASGLTVVFGVMKILNVAHGAFYAWGAYTAAFLIGIAANAGLPDATGFAAIGFSAALVGIILGLAVERTILKRLYGRSEVAIVLATFGVFLILEDLLLLIFGTDAYFAYQPMMVLGGSTIMGVPRDNYSLLLIGFASVVALALWLGISHTKWGRLLATVIHDRETATFLGINVGRIFILTFVIGTALGALGGGAVAPMISVAPGIGIDIVVLSFAVVVIGGMGSIPGAALGALLVGLTRAAAVHYAPEFELFSVYAAMTGVLIFRPRGLIAPPEPRKV